MPEHRFVCLSLTACGDVTISLIETEREEAPLVSSDTLQGKLKLMVGHQGYRSGALSQRTADMLD